MLKSIATACSESTKKHENNASYNTDYIVPDLVGFFDNDGENIKTLIEKRKAQLIYSRINSPQKGISFSHKT